MLLVSLIFLFASALFSNGFHIRLPATSLRSGDRLVLTLSASSDDDSKLHDVNSSFQNDPALEYSIDSFLRGDYEHAFADDAPAPVPGWTPRETVEQALRWLRKMDTPTPCHGAAVLLRFCVPLTRGERWSQDDNNNTDPWKRLMRGGALNASLMAQKIRTSQDFSELLEWSKLDVTEGAVPHQRGGVAPSIAFVNVALYFEQGVEPSIIQFQLKRVGGVWLIDSARKSHRTLFADDNK